MPTENWSEEKLEKLLNKQSQLSIRVIHSLNELKEPFTILALVEPKEYSGIRDGIIQKYSKSDVQVIFLSLNAGYLKIMQDLQKENLDPNKIFFIDMISIERNLEPKKAPNVVYLESPKDLTEAMIQVVKKFDGKAKTILVLDSISTLLIYNDKSSTEKFVHTLIGKTNANKSSALLLTSDAKQNEVITKTIAQFVDKTIAL
ncbi:MAG: hypothetical protein CL944_03125 [Candidatus Diapherotrites archaeon]|uniref:KaiC-like domain-containing protein n=1 Tax=Candidatus Iainarchaeum sp. TaxID=3101447 RepID=A0A2D6LQP9_9ARCH|nr:hypothetical protein [Candidatus Diapherotrites archaeon]|tara:strand:- start:5295 stop:5900 length:606 start_codon:yes stop_codon:yes gene_type:complete